jgi:hypothetical protein
VALKACFHKSAENKKSIPWIDFKLISGEVSKELGFAKILEVSQNKFHLNFVSPTTKKCFTYWFKIERKGR